MNLVPTDMELVARCKRELPHQHTAFEQLVTRYQNMVFTLCYRLAGRASVAEELTQEVFTKVFLNVREFEERSAFSSWVYRIAYNHCLNFLARVKRVRQGIAEYTDAKQLADAAKMSAEFSDEMQQVLNQLNEEQRSILIMKYVMELELVEISTILNIGVGAVKMRLLRAREEFRKIYQSPQTFTKEQS